MFEAFIYGKTSVFIDAANILYSQQSLGWRVDYQKLKAFLESQCDLMSIHFYTGRVGLDYKQNNFLAKLERLSYKVTSKEVKKIRTSENTFVQKGNLDIELALDAYRLSETFDTLILFSGDSDFAYLLDLLKRQRKKVLVVSAKGHISQELINRAKYIKLNKMRSYIEFLI